jgi:Fic family protein
MKLPKRPPSEPNDPDELIAMILPKPTREISDLIARADLEQWNFEDFEHRAKAGGVDPVAVWRRIRFFRRVRSLVLPLETMAGNPFRFRIEPSMQRQLREFDLSLGGGIVHDRPGLTTEEERRRYLITSLAEEAIESSRLEGAITTREKAREMIRENRSPRDPHERMILNNYEAMRRLADWKSSALTMELLLEIHRTLTAGVMPREDQSGRLRNASEKFNVWDEVDQQVLHAPPPAEALPERLGRMFSWINEPDRSDAEFTHPVIKAITLHFWLAYEHPFVDGNGRTARALFYWAMLRAGYWLIEYIPISNIIVRQRTAYARAFLNAEQDGEDLNYFLVNQLRVLELATGEFHRHVERKREERDRLTAIVGAALFNARQQALLTRALRDPTTRFRYATHANSHGITLATARTDLLELEERGLLVGNRRGRSFEFVAAPELETRLQRLRRGSSRA